MDAIQFDAVDLMTRDQLAGEIIGRTKKPTLVIFEEDDGEGMRCFQAYFPETDPRSKDGAAISFLLRRLADSFEGCEYHPGEAGKGGE